MGKVSALGATEAYLSALYRQYLTQPSSVDPSWVPFFRSLDGSLTEEQPSWTLQKVQEDTPEVEGALRVASLIRSYRLYGHRRAHLDPLSLSPCPDHPLLRPEAHGLTPTDGERPFFLGNTFGLQNATLHQVIEACERVYCGTVGFEFMHISTEEERTWLLEHIEKPDPWPVDRASLLANLTQADAFEVFLDKKYRGTKRFGLDGGESLVPLLEHVFRASLDEGMEEVVVGMAHRGRLNILGNVLRKPYHQIMQSFNGTMVFEGSGDVKYHLGASANRVFDGRSLHVSLSDNPSHLEAVNTVVLGRVKAKQRLCGDTSGHRIMSLLLHGDAAFIGQGIVAETFLLSQLNGYAVGGTLHIVINNQIGFTTSPEHTRSSLYCSDMAKTVEAPIFHVNGDDPDACVRVARLATKYRQTFKKDVVIDMWCYRRHGHNEGDEPMFTQPLLYKEIKKHPRVREVYAHTLDREGVLPLETSKKLFQDSLATLEKEFEKATSDCSPHPTCQGLWSAFSKDPAPELTLDTGVALKTLQDLSQLHLPENFSVHPKIMRQLKKRHTALMNEGEIDWGTAEHLAFASLLHEGTSVRLSGEDSQRGTFSHRHSVLVDQEKAHTYTPLDAARAKGAVFEVINSPLSEFGLLGFEYGYASASPYTLVLWEAQFGDFSNGAQVIIDQFIASGEEKWDKKSGLVLLLPHGYEGQGPEHTSARPERYLQLCAEDNMLVCYTTTPANYFHVLRRQIRQPYRKPLVHMSPKSLLRHKACVSPLLDFVSGTSFQPVLADAREDLVPERIRRVVLCSGKIYYDLEAERNARGIEDVSLVRIEQLYPFPTQTITDLLSRFPKAEIVWCQEESRNGGAWSYILETLGDVVGSLRYVGRPPSASPATGDPRRHKKEQTTLVSEALSVYASQLRKVGS